MLLAVGQKSAITSLNSVFDHDSEDLGAEELEDTVLLYRRSAGDAGDGVHDTRKGEGQE